MTKDQIEELRAASTKSSSNTNKTQEAKDTVEQLSVQDAVAYLIDYDGRNSFFRSLRDQLQAQVLRNETPSLSVGQLNKLRTLTDTQKAWVFAHGLESVGNQLIYDALIKAHGQFWTNQPSGCPFCPSANTKAAATA